MPLKLGGIGSLAFCILASCFPGEDELVDGMFTQEEWSLIKTFELKDGPPASPTNKYADRADAAAFGQRLFFEKGYSRGLTVPGSGLGNVGEAGRVSCASCHDPEAYFTDVRSRPNATSLGVSWSNRNSPSLVNAVYYTWGSWGGKDDHPWHQGANGSESNSNFSGNRLQFAHLIYAKYKDDYEALFGPLPAELDLQHPDAARFPLNGRPKSATAMDGDWEQMTKEDRDAINLILANTGKALEAYERKLVSHNAPIDLYIRGETSALSPAAKRGLKLFIGKAACVDCHFGPTFTDQSFHNTGVPQVGATAARSDTGRYDDLSRTLSNTFNGAGEYSDDRQFGADKLAGMELTDDIKGKFRTKSLRHVEKTAPFMHDGSIASLSDVVRFYNWGGGASGFEGNKSALMVPLGLTQTEENDLVAFLEALTGEPVPEQYGDDTSNKDGKYLFPDGAAVCGNSFREFPKEQCDDGNTASGDGCDSNCTPTGCGNGVRTSGEACDDGNLVNGDGCSSSCDVENPPPP